MDGQVLAELIERSKAELLALAIPEAGDSLTTTQTDKQNQTVPGEVVTAPTEHEETREATRLEDVPTGQNTENHHITMSLSERNSRFSRRLREKTYHQWLTDPHMNCANTLFSADIASIVRLVGRAAVKGRQIKGTC